MSLRNTLPENRRITTNAVITESTTFALQIGQGAFRVSLYLTNYVFIELGNSMHLFDLVDALCSTNNAGP